MTDIDTATCQHPEENNKLPFSDYFCGELLAHTRFQPNKIILDWAQQINIVERLKEWKAEELDDIYNYAKLVEVIGFDLNREKWRRNVNEVVNRMMKPPPLPNIGEGTLSEYQMMKTVATFLKSWGKFVNQIVEAANIPGEDRQDICTNGTFVRKVAYSLLLTALMDLQDNPVGFFQQLLGGPAIPCPSAEGKIKIPKGRLPGYSRQDRDEANGQGRSRSTTATTDRKRAAPMYHSDDEDGQQSPDIG